jgi:hypothetical protein
VIAEKARIVQSEENAFARQRLTKEVILAKSMHATIQEMLETVFSTQSLRRLHNEGTSCVYRVVKQLSASK